MISFLEEANNIKEELITIRRDLHEHPELGFKEERTSMIIKEFLKKEGIAYTAVAKTGVCAIIKGDGDGIVRTVGIRADMDALPLQDKKSTPYSSKESGKMHACGHDAHTTILLGIGKILNKNKNLFAGNVKLIFEPAEETIGGAPLMIKEGVLDNPRVQAMFGLHVNEVVDCGKISLKKGVINAASNPFKIKIKGRGGHGAAPQQTVDPIIISSEVILALQTIASREVSPFNPIVVTVGSIHGGTAQNIIPEEVLIEGVIRTITTEDRKFVIERVKAKVENICISARGKCEIEIEESYPCLYNNDGLVELVEGNAIELLGKDCVIKQKNPSLGVESFAYFAEVIPSAFYYLGTGSEKKNTREPAHSSLFDIDEEAIPIGVALQCTNVLKYLTRG